ncbi:DUF1598 domain-containing protein [Pirellulaceae bacterium SH449]
MRSILSKTKAFLSKPLQLMLMAWLVAGIWGSTRCAGQQGESSSNPPGNTASSSSDPQLRSQLSEIDRYRLDRFQAGMEPSRKGGAAGGSPLANFDELMNIIETVVDGGWESQGGTSSMIPHRNGVRISTSGVMERISPSEESLRELRQMGKPKADLSALGSWQEPTSLRWISLRSLDELVADRMLGNKPSSVAMELLGGIYRLDYLAFDEENNDWLLGGPAGNLGMHVDGQLVNQETGMPPILLEDLLSIAPVILNSGRDFGCTINPDENRLREAHAFAQRSSSLRELRNSPDRWLETWKKMLGNQATIVIGLPADSPTGLALLIADAAMKRLGMGVDSLPRPAKSYWAELDSIRQSETSTMMRWWLSLSDTDIALDKERRIYSLENNNVQLRSESQHFEASGKRTATGKVDPAANRFAESFTKNYRELIEPYPIFGRLQHIMDLAVALEIVRLEMEHGRGELFTALSSTQVQPRMPVAAKEIESIAATHKGFDGSQMATVSGGVGVTVSHVRKRIKVTMEELNRVDIKSSNLDQNAKDRADRDKEVFWR